MGTTVEFIESKVIVYKVADPWSVNELIEANIMVEEILEATPTPVDVIADVRQLQRMYGNVMEMRRSPAFRHANMNRLVIVGANPLLEKVVKAIFTMTQFKNAYFCRSVDEAMRYIEAHRV